MVGSIMARKMGGWCGRGKGICPCVIIAPPLFMGAIGTADAGKALGQIPATQKGAQTCRDDGSQWPQVFFIARRIIGQEIAEAGVQALPPGRSARSSGPITGTHSISEQMSIYRIKLELFTMNCLVAWLDSACFSRLLDLKRGLKLRAKKTSRCS